MGDYAAGGCGKSGEFSSMIYRLWKGADDETCVDLGLEATTDSHLL